MYWLYGARGFATGKSERSSLCKLLAFEKSLSGWHSPRIFVVGAKPVNIFVPNLIKNVIVPQGMWKLANML